MPDRPTSQERIAAHVERALKLDAETDERIYEECIASGKHKAVLDHGHCSLCRCDRHAHDWPLWARRVRNPGVGG